MEPAKRASALFLHVDTVAREVRAAAGRDVAAGYEVMGKITELSRDFFAPEAVDSGCQEVLYAFCFSDAPPCRWMDALPGRFCAGAPSSGRLPFPFRETAGPP